MTDFVNEHFKKYHQDCADEDRSHLSGFQPLCPKIQCADGLSLSVQAGRTHYCHPRENLWSYEDYRQVEIGYPSERIEEFMQYIDGDPETTDPLDTVYGYVPVDIVNAVIEQHGGLIEISDEPNPNSG